jgi:hypothetical protein
MQAPSGEAGTLALSVGALAAGAVAGATVGAAGVNGASSDAKHQAAVAGGLVGVLATGFGGLLVEEFSPKWANVGSRTALIGVGAITLAAAFGVAKSLTSFRSGLQQAPQLSSPNASGGTAYTAGSVDNGRTLTMAPGDTITVSLATPPDGQSWMWATSGGVVAYTAHTVSGVADVSTFTANTPGSGQLVGTRTQTTPATGQALETFTINVNVVGSTS